MSNGQWLGSLFVVFSIATWIGCGDEAKETAKRSEKSGGGATSSAADAGEADDSTPAKATGTEAEARALLEKFVAPGADHTKLSVRLQPASDDYRAVFDEEFARRAEATYGPVWKSGQLVVKPKQGQTEVRLISATTDDLKAWNERAENFPGGYEQVAGKFKPGLTVYGFKFVEPGESLGMAYDGLVFVNGNWRIFPKPWRIR